MELFGLHEFALLKPDALRPLVSLDDCPNKTVRVVFLIFSWCKGRRACKYNATTHQF